VRAVRPTVRAILPAPLLLALLCSPHIAQAQRGAITAHRNLAEITEAAANIIEGAVVSARVEPHPTLNNLQTVVVTVRVARTLKGPASRSFEFRQLIWDIRDRADNGGYRRGEHLLLFMNRPSAYGLSSPIGLEQGRFRIMGDRGRGFMAINGQANAALLKGVAPRLEAAQAQMPTQLKRLVQTHQHGPIRLDDLSQLVLLLQFERSK